MPKVTLTDLTAGYGLQTAYNANNDAIEVAFDNTISRDGSTPNAMAAQLDMNSNKIINVADGTTAAAAVNYRQLMNIQYAELSTDATPLVPTYAALSALPSPSDGDTAIVTGEYIAGLFVYESARSAENDSGTVIDGWVRHYDGPVYVTWFGADPTGATDSTAAFNLATRANYVSTGNFDLNFPQAVATGPGQFRITGTVWVHKGQHLMGAGEGATRILLDTTTANTDPIFVLGYNSITAFASGDAGGLAPEISGMWTSGGPSTKAVIWSGANGVTIHDMFLTSPGIGIEIDGTDGRVTNCQLDGGLNAMQVGGHTHVFSNILIFNMNYGIITKTGGGGGCSETVFNNVHFNFIKYVSVQFSEGVDHRNIAFGDCNFVLNVQHATFEAFVLVACTSAKGIAFNDCQFNNMRGPAYKHSNGINNEIYFNDCLFSGVMTATDYNQSTTSRAAIIFNEKVWFYDCQFVGLHTEPLLLNGGTAETRVFIQGGVFRSSSATALATINTTASTPGASFTVYGMDFDQMNMPVVVESAMTQSWHIGTDRALPMTGQGATASHILPFGHNSVYLVDTTTAAATINIQRAAGFTPMLGERLTFIDAKGTWHTNPATFSATAVAIDGVVADYVARGGGRISFVYEAGGWRAERGAVGADAAQLLTGATTLTAAQSGQRFYLNSVGGFGVTLPPPALGLRYHFNVYLAPGATGYAINTHNGDNVLVGFYQDVLGELEGFTSQDRITFVGSTSVYGDRCDVASDGAGWHCMLYSRVNGGMTASVIT